METTTEMGSHGNKRPKIEKKYNFHNDLLVEIFVHFPVKSLCRFKCISKFWNSMIRDKSFMDRRKTSLLWQMDDDDGYNLNVYSIDSNGFATLDSRYVFAGCFYDLEVCRGLLCYYASEKTIAVFNTFTKKAFPLPCLPDTQFGFDALSQRYKLVGWDNSVRDGITPIEFKVLALDKDCSWKPVNNTLGILYVPGNHSTVGGTTVYWLDVKGGNIILFDLHTEEFWAVKLPSGIDPENFGYDMFEFEGTVCLVEQPLREKGRCMLDIVNLWILKDLHSSAWLSLMKNVTLPMEGTDLGEVYSGFDVYNDIGEFLADHSVVSSNGDILIMTNDFEDPYIFSYSFLNRQVTRVKVVGTKSMRLAMGIEHVKGQVNPEKFLPRWCGRPVRQGK